MGSYQGSPNAEIRIEFFANSSLEPSGYGEGERYVGNVQVTTDAFGIATFDSPLFGDLTFGDYVSSTATDASGNTSEFSAAVPVSFMKIAGAPSISEGENYYLQFVTSTSSPQPDGWLVDWGDGIVETLLGDATDANHVYADGPANFEIQAWAIVDGSNNPAANAIDVDVLNIAPQQFIPPTLLLNEGDSLALDSYTFSDPEFSLFGFNRIRASHVDWGDGTVSQTGEGRFWPLGHGGAAGNATMGSILSGKPCIP